MGGCLKIEEFVTFMLGGLETKKAFGNVRARLRKALESDPQALHRVYQAFEGLNTSGSGKISLEVSSCFGDSLSLFRVVPSNNLQRQNAFFHFS